MKLVKKVKMFMKKRIDRVRLFNIVIACFSILFAAVLAIVVHAVMPSPGATMNVNDFNSLPVKLFGFPAVASAYFLFIYLDIFIVLCYFGKKSNLDRKKIGFRFGVSFALIYLVGMQEIVVKSSPFTIWGIKYVLYQLFMGLGDAIPAFILCIITARFFLKKEPKTSERSGIFAQNNRITIVVVALAFFVERVIGYVAGYIDSDIKQSLIPVLSWTGIFGIAIGFAYILLYPIYNNKNNTKLSSFQISVLTLGLNWILFNSFIGMILADTILKMLLRSGIDVFVLFLVTFFRDKYLQRKSV